MSNAAPPTSDAHGLTHAGGVVTRVRDGDTLVLLVRARPAPHDWVLPKGHIEPGEVPETAARREVREEAGVDGEIVRYVGRIDFTKDHEDVRAGYFLMRYAGEVPASEHREKRWCTFDDALSMVRFDDTGALLRRARDGT